MVFLNISSFKALLVNRLNVAEFVWKYCKQQLKKTFAIPRRSSCIFSHPPASFCSFLVCPFPLYPHQSLTPITIMSCSLSPHYCLILLTISSSSVFLTLNTPSNQAKAEWFDCWFRLIISSFFPAPSLLLSRVTQAGCRFWSSLVWTKTRTSRTPVFSSFWMSSGKGSVGKFARS